MNGYNKNNIAIHPWLGSSGLKLSTARNYSQDPSPGCPLQSAWLVTLEQDATIQEGVKSAKDFQGIMVNTWHLQVIFFLVKQKYITASG